MSKNNLHISNYHIVEYLKYYLKLSNPDFAVLINAPWGSGKTHFVKQFLENSEENTFYFSLYGVSDAIEIERAVIKKILNDKSGGFSEKIGKFGAAVTSFMSRAKIVGTSFDVKNMDPLQYLSAVSLLNNYTVIFDDFERAELSKVELLGYINKFVEHGNQKVVIIAAEDQISSEGKYLITKEKIIGKTFLFSSSYDEAFLSFIRGKEYGTIKATMDVLNSEIKALFFSMNISSLRILKGTISDFVRFYANVSGEYKKNTLAMRELILNFFELSFIFRSGWFMGYGISDAIGFLEIWRIGEFDDERLLTQVKQNKLEKLYYYFKKRTQLSQFSDTILSINTFQNIIFNSYYDSVLINEELEKSPSFKPPVEQPIWFKVVRIFDICSIQFEELKAEWEDNYEKRKFTDTGNMLHMFSAKLFLEEIGVISNNLESPSDYLNWVCKESELEDTIQDWDGEPRALGHNFGRENDDVFKDLLYQVRVKAEKQRENIIQLENQDLLKLLKNDTDLFLKKINERGSSYLRLPTLCKLDVDQFVDIVLSDDFKHIFKLFKEIRNRYDTSFRNHREKEEHDWLVKVKDRLIAKAKLKSNVQKHWVEIISNKDIKETLKITNA